MKKSVVILTGLAMSVVLSCRTRPTSPSSSVRANPNVTSEDQALFGIMGDKNRLSTQDAINELANVASQCQQDEKFCQGGQFQLNHKAYNTTVQGLKLDTEADFSKAPYEEIKICPQSEKKTLKGKEVCNVVDNAFSYVYKDGAKVAKPYINLIPQKKGEDQPEMNRWFQAGDIVVHWHPERRSAILSDDAMQWRNTHSATIITKKTASGKFLLGTTDTPSGYARPFTGVSPTIFHVFRWMPKDQSGNDLPENVAQRYRAMFAKWGTLGYDKFPFNGDYNSAAGALTGTDDIWNKFGTKYLEVAQGKQSVIPPMYCAWFVYTNLNLAWMHPLNKVDNNLLGDFSAIKPGFAFNGDSSKQSYLSHSNDLTTHSDYVFAPMSGADLVQGFLVRLVGEDSTIKDPRVFVTVAMQKAGILKQMAQDNTILQTFQSSDGLVPRYDATRAGQLNANIPQYFAKFAGLYAQKAQDVQQAGSNAVQAMNAAILELEDAYKDQTLHADFRDVKKRWIPPYIYGFEAENFDVRSQFGRPQMMYVGTVVPEEYIKIAGTPSTVRLTPKVSSQATQEDADLDEAMYKILGQPPKGDGMGFDQYFRCLAKLQSSNCGSKIKRHFNQYERDVLLTLANDWRIDGSLQQIDEKTIKLRNDFGLDPVIFRKVLAAYWNDPHANFRPNINAGLSSNLNSVTKNLRTLLTDIPVTLNSDQADASVYSAGEPTASISCTRGSSKKVPEYTQGNLPSCEHALEATSTEVYQLSAADAGLYAKGWPKGSL